MRHKKFFGIIMLFISASGLCLFCSAQIGVPHRAETITFQSGDFKLVGELRVPEGDTIHPLVIMVHGDGPATRTYFALLKNAMLRAGYATLMWDKPGSGQSTGSLSQENRLAERAGILVDAVRAMKKHAAIDPDRIGLWGISQAGYVMPLALERTDDIKFMIVVGGPGMNGIDQTAYLIRRQLMFAGVPDDKALQMEAHFKGLYTARTFEEYIGYARPLFDDPVQKRLGFVSALWEKGNWKPRSPDEEAFFNPMGIIERTSIPVLALFGEKDTQVDPVQGAESYRKTLAKAGNKDFRVEVIPGADHNLILCKTGSLKERSGRSREEWQDYAPKYLEIMENWLRERGPMPPQRTATDNDGNEDISGCWEGAPDGKFGERNRQWRLISRGPGGRTAITLIYDLTPRCQVWEYDIEVAVEDGAVSWEAHRGRLSEGGDSMTVVKDWKGERSTWTFTRRKDQDAWMRRMASSTGKDYAYEVPESLDDGWICADLADAGFDKGTLLPFLRGISKGRHDDIHSLLIVKDGRLVLEEYFATNGKRYGPFIEQAFRERPHHLASVTKGVLSALCGMAVDRGLIESVDEPIDRRLPAYTDSFTEEKRAITVGHLLTMTPGWAWEQFRYPWTDPRNDAAAMYDRPDVIRFVLDRSQAAKPGAKFNYSNGAPVALEHCSGKPSAWMSTGSPNRTSSAL